MTADVAELSLTNEIKACIRARGAVVDLAFARTLYEPLLERQQREGVDIVRDLAYGEHARHRLDIYRPQQTTAALPIVLLIHGGGFVRGDKSERENFGHYFAREGCIVAIANYRLAPEATWPAGAEDVIGAYRWLHSHAHEYGGDSRQMFLCGESAGAAHAATAALIRRFHPAGGLGLAGLMLISGVYDVELDFRARRQFGVATPDPRNEPYFGSAFSRYREMSTVRLIDAAPLPTLITYAELDTPQMHVQAGQLFAALVTRHGFSPDLNVVPGHNHLTQLLSVNTGDESLTRILKVFLAKHS